MFIDLIDSRTAGWACTTTLIPQTPLSQNLDKRTEVFIVLVLYLKTFLSKKSAMGYPFFPPPPPPPSSHLPPPPLKKKILS